MKSGLSYRIEQDRKNKKATGIAAKKFTTRVSKKKNQRRCADLPQAEKGKHNHDNKCD
jgi:hypothetical protein